MWVFEISGAAPASHFVGGYAGAVRERQPPMYFPLGRGKAVILPEAELRERWNSPTPQWSMMNAVLYGATRDQMMARHKANHIQDVYAPDALAADHAPAIKAAMFAEMGIRAHLCGEVKPA